MKHLWSGFMLALATTVGAQAVQTQTSPQQPANRTASSAAITVTGCVQPSTAVGSGSSSGSSGAATSAPPAHFVLMQPSTMPPSGAATAAGTPTSAAGVTGASAAPTAVGTSGSSVPVSHYILHGRDGDLAKYSGQRVEIIGTSSHAAPSGGAASEKTPDTTTQVIPHEPQRGTLSTAPATGAPPAGTPPTAHPSVQHLTVQSVRMLAATCP
jgi:hypothetical protein